MAENEAEYNDCINHFSDDPFINIKPWNRDYNNLRVEIKGKEDTPYEGGKFVFEIKFKKRSTQPNRLTISEEDLDKTVLDYKRKISDEYNFESLF